MSSPERTDPPRLAHVLLVWAAGRLGLPELPEDASDLFRARVRTQGAGPALRWYVRQALAAGVRAMVAERSACGGSGGARSAGVRGLVSSLQLGLRRVRRAPGASLMFSLVVGVGMAGAAFMVQVRHSMLRPDLGLGRPVEVASWIDSTGSVSPALRLTGEEPWLGDTHPSVEALAPFWQASVVLTTPQGLLRSFGQAVLPGYLTRLGAGLSRGRDIEAAGQLVLSHHIWLQRWGVERNPVGTTIEVDGSPYRIVGIAAPGFDGPLCCVPPDFWVAKEPGAGPAVIAAVGVRDRAAAEAWLDDRARAASRGVHALLGPAESAAYGGDSGIVARTLTVLMALAAVAWLATLLTGVNLILTETLARRGELRLRRALGARPGHLVTQSFVDTAWLAAFAALVAAVVAWLATAIAPWLLPMIGARSSVDLLFGRSGVVAIVGATAISVLACALPAAATTLGLSRVPRVERGPAGSGFASAGLSTQVGLAGALLVVTGVFVGWIRALDGDFVGFRHGQTAVYFVSSDADAPSADEVVSAAIAGRPGSLAALTLRLPVYGARLDSIDLGSGARVRVAHERVTESFFETIGGRLVAGAPGRSGAEGVVSEDLAIRLAVTPAEAIGREIGLDDGSVVRVVGVVERASWGSGDVRPTLYRGWGAAAAETGVLLMRTPDGAAPSTGELLRALRPLGVALQPFETLDGLLLRSRVLEVFLARLASAFGLLALLVALGGIHAHFLHWVRARARALSVCAALGAPARRLGWDIASAALRLVAPGLITGCLGGWLATATLGGLLGAEGAPDWRSYAVVAAIVLATTAVALLTPIVRAGRADPLSLLRAE